MNHQSKIGVWDAPEPEKENMTVEKINKQIKDSGVDTNLVSDSYHTFGELYEARKCLNAALFNEWADYHDRDEMPSPLHDVHKSWRHHDGELCFGGGWFIVVAVLPTGQISYHYEAKDWDLFRIPEVEKAKYEFDGHTSADVLERLKTI
jgi:hypothetical protein